MELECVGGPCDGDRLTVNSSLLPIVHSGGCYNRAWLLRRNAEGVAVGYQEVLRWKPGARVYR